MTSTSAAKPQGRSGLSRERVARAALELVDEQGLERLSMRRVAESLGVGTMTLYGYFRDKDDLLDAVIDIAVENRPLTGEGTWREQLTELIQSARVTLTRHPALVLIRFRRPVLRPDALHFSESAMGILTQAGFGTSEATKVFRLLFTYTFGFAGLSPSATTEQARNEAAAAIAALSPEDYPNLTAAAREASHSMSGDELFDYGLERILDGLAARLAQRK